MHPMEKLIDEELKKEASRDFNKGYDKGYADGLKAMGNLLKAKDVKYKKELKEINYDL